MQSLTVFIGTWAALGAASTATATTATFASILTGLTIALLGLHDNACRSCFVTNFWCALAVIATLAVARWSVTTVTTFIAFRTFTTRSALGALLVASSVLLTWGLQTYVSAWCLAFGVKAFTVSVDLAW